MSRKFNLTPVAIVTPALIWNGSTISRHELSKTARRKCLKLMQNNKIDFRYPPVLAEKQGRGHYLFVPPEWGNDQLEFQIAMQMYAKTPGIMKVI